MRHYDKSIGEHQQVVVGLSGGVDSAVAAALLQARGYTVTGVALRTWKAPSLDPSSAPARSMGDPLDRARAIADHLGLPLREKDLQRHFYRQVVEPFAAAYAEGKTPNPCVFCNPTLKFAALLEEADAVGARWIATGHYARVVHADGQPSRLLRAQAEAKDQSYALYRLTQQHLQRLLLPLGEVASKDEVRDIARRHQLPVAADDDSQDLCFVAVGDHPELVASLRPDATQPGPIYDLEGRVVGEHRGLPAYTVGQRSGLGIAAPHRLYVVRLEPERNALVVGPRSELAITSCRLVDVSFTSGSHPVPPQPGEEDTMAVSLALKGRIRYRAPLVPVQVDLRSESEAQVTFATPQFGVAPGQSLVFYRGEEVLGGGIIA